MKLTTLILMLSASMASAQLFHSDEEFYNFIEHRQRSATVQAEAIERARTELREKEDRARTAEQERVSMLVREEIDRRALDAINYFRAERGEPLIAIPVPQPEVRRALPASPPPILTSHQDYEGD